MSKNALGKYQILAQLGRGGMSDVYLAATQGPSGFSKLLVVKVLQSELARSGEFLAMFRDEARLAARLNHPNIVQTYEVGECDGHHFIAMEYLEGQPLSRVSEKFRETNRLSIGATLRIGIDALAGLHYAHEIRDLDGRPLGVVHRDITPQNVFVSYEGQIKLVDFGIAKAFDSTTQTKVGTVKGKVAYMAPEQARGEDVGRTADIFSMGILLWELLAGGRLWEGLTDIAVVGRLVQGDIPHLKTVRPDLSATLTSLVMSALDPDPTVRPQTAEDFQKGLEAEFDSLTTRLSTRQLGEIMREEFQDQRIRVRNVVKKQFERLARDTPTGTTPPLGLRLGAFSPEDFPVLSERSTIHDAPTTINTSVTDELLASHSSAITTNQTPPLVQVAAQSAQPSNMAWVAILSVGLSSLAIGITQPWKHFLKPSEGNATMELASVAAESPTERKFARQGAEPLTRPSCLAQNKPLVELTGEIDSDAVLTCDKDYLLRFTTYVRQGATLTIEPGTTIKGDFETKGVLVIQPGARIHARGTEDSPIVFTSARSSGKKSGDWGGVVLLGLAPINLKDGSGEPMVGHVEGLTIGGQYGGSNPNDSSGVLSHVRIEYCGTEIAPNNEINGLTFGGVGRGTVVDHVQVRHSADDCFEFFGGTLDAKYLVCQHPEDDAFDWDYGYTGRLQFLVAQASPEVTSGSNGFEGDNDPNGTKNSPVSSPTIYNVTLCGKNRRLETQEHFGVLVRRGSQLRMRNGLFMGFAAGLDVRDPGTKINLAASIFHQNLVYNLAYPESDTATATARKNDDAGFNEVAYMTNPGLRISDEDPKLGNCFDATAPGFKPAVALTRSAAIPPNDGFFDSDARYVGAFRDRDDDWDRGKWLIWTD